MPLKLLVNQWIQQQIRKFTILYLDIDQFKLVNDILRALKREMNYLQDIADKKKQSAVLASWQERR